MFALIVLTVLGRFFVADAFGEDTVALANIYHQRPSIMGPPKEVLMSDVDQLDSKENIVLVIHGYLASRNHISVVSLNQAFLSMGFENFFAADWERTVYLDYITTRSLVNATGQHFAKIIQNFIKKHDVDPKDIHIIGHSLGAHVAGVIGKAIEGLGRITGLDPAGPLFTPRAPDSLWPTDANFVECVHTDDLVYGDSNPRGHVDFYINCGRASQPGCVITDILSLTACSHYKAPIYYAEAIHAPRTYPAVPCSLRDIRNPLMPHCIKGSNFSNVAFMGELTAQNVTGVYCLETYGLPPYGMGDDSVFYRN